MGALGYLLKPPKTEELCDILARAQTALSREDERAFLCRINDRLYRIPRQSILYFHSNRRQVTCVA